MMNKPIINDGFTIDGCYVPAFKLTPGKLIRIYISSFSRLNKPIGFDLALKIIKLFTKDEVVSGLHVLKRIPYAKHYKHTIWDKLLGIKTAEDYLIKKFRATPNQVECILHKLEIRADERIGLIGFVEKKLLTVEGLFIQNRDLVFDYYGVDALGIDKMNRLLKHSIDEGKSLIGFDNLQYMEEAEPYINFERIIVEADNSY